MSNSFRVLEKCVTCQKTENAGMKHFKTREKLDGKRWKTCFYYSEKKDEH